jgi:nucleotide-binding universal stress UspA family protein
MFPFKKILVPTDFSEPSLCGLKMANEMADKFGSEVIVVNVHKPVPHLPTPRMETADISFDYSAYEKQIAEDAHDNLARISQEIMHDHITPRLVVRMGRPADEILKVAEEENVDSIFIATHGRTGLAHILFGSVAEKVVRNASCAVLSIRACD